VAVGTGVAVGAGVTGATVGVALALALALAEALSLAEAEAGSAVGVATSATPTLVAEGDAVWLGSAVKPPSVHSAVTEPMSSTTGRAIVMARRLRRRRAAADTGRAMPPKGSGMGRDLFGGHAPAARTGVGGTAPT
jgi:hypothetical protein